MKKKILIKLICLIALMVTFANCQRKKVKKYYYKTGELLSEIEYNKIGQKDGELREYYKSGTIKTKEYYNEDKIIDTTIGFDRNGKIIVKRYKDKGNEIFEKYHVNGQLLSKGKMTHTVPEGVVVLL